MHKNSVNKGNQQGDVYLEQLVCPNVVTVIVTFNPNISSFTETLRAQINTCVSSVIIVDNASLNYSAIEQAVNNFGLPSFDLVRLPNNVGIGAAQNIGIRRAIDAGCSHVILFDQDSLPSHETVRALLADESKLITAGVHVGAIGPSFCDPHTGSYFPQGRIVGPMLKKVWINPRCGTPVEVSFIIASGSLIRTEVLKKVGQMNENFFIDKVDHEWCFRARAKGFSMFVSPTAVMSHSIGDFRVRSLGREISIHSPLRRYYMARNAILLARQPWVPAGYRLRELFYVFARMPDFLVSVNFNWNYIKLMLTGVLHGFLGRGGPYKS